MKLFAGPFVGEFGHELFCWQGKIRQISKRFEFTTIACLPGHNVLYEDFANEIIEYSPQTYEPDCSFNRGQTGNVPMPDPKVDKYIGPNKQLIKVYDPNQQFIRFGKKVERKYDIIFAARNTNKLRSGYRNWAKEKWDKLSERLLNDNFSIGSIGLSNMSYIPKGTENLQDIDLKTLANILHSSKIIVGGSSGPMHFATLCNTPQVVWSGDNLELNKERYLNWWNPFKVPVTFLPEKRWDPSVDLIYEKTKEAISLHSRN